MLKTIQDMPKGVASLYFIQAFSTFSFAILYSSLPLYIVKQLGMSSTSANSIVGLFLAFNYILQLMGGLIGGRFLSNRILFFVTLVIQSVGLLVLAQAKTPLLYIGLTLFLVGCGLNTTCYNSMLTQRFGQKDDRREAAFIFSYAAMNMGFCIGYIASGFFDYSNQYQFLFYFCLVTNMICLLLVSLNWSSLVDKTTPLSAHSKNPIYALKNGLGTLLTLFLIPALFLCFHSANFSNGIIITLSLIMFGIVFTLGLQQNNTADKQKIMAYLILAFSSIVFWMIYLTGPIGITLFIKHNVDKHFLGFELATQWVKNINPITIILGAPLLALMGRQFNAKGVHLSISTQFMIAFMSLGLSFFFLCVGILCANSQGYSALYWIIAYNITQGLSELLIAPVGLAMIGRIAPPRLQGVLMGTWMLISGIGASFSPYLSNRMIKTESINPLTTNSDFLQVFKELGLWSVIGALFLFFISKNIKKLIDDQDETPETRVKLLQNM